MKSPFITLLTLFLAVSFFGQETEYTTLLIPDSLKTNANTIIRENSIDITIKSTEDKFLVSITIPQGYKVETFPETMAIGLPDNLGTFKYKTSVKGNKVQTLCIIQFNRGKIAPQYYTILKDFYGQMVDKQNERIVLTKQ